MPDSTYIAVDIGAGSARVLAGCYDGHTLELNEVHRMTNAPMVLPTGEHWNVGGLFEGIVQGLTKARQLYGDTIVSIGIDAFGNGYGLQASDGRLLGLPYHYRDPRTEGKMEYAFAQMSERDLFVATGAQSYFFNTLFQVLADLDARPALLPLAKDLLFISDILNYWLCGVVGCERTMASCSQLYDMTAADWAYPVFEKLGIPKELFPELVAPGDVLGPLLKPIQELTGLSQTKVVAVGSHDTASAVAGIPHQSSDSVFLSSGTWSLMGLELPQPICSDEAFEAGFTNELGLEGTTRFIQNIGGLWLLQESRRQWQREGLELSFGEMAAMASEAEPFRSLIDPNDPVFRAAGDMPARIRSYCENTGQDIPQSPAQIIRCIYESLALSYSEAWAKMEHFSPVELTRLNIVGGGCQDALLNQLTANAIGKPVWVGPVEATGIGNIISQMISNAEVASLSAGRELIAKSFPCECIDPVDTFLWDDARSRFRAMVSGHSLSLSTH